MLYYPQQLFHDFHSSKLSKLPGRKVKQFESTVFEFWNSGMYRLETEI